MSVFDDLLQPDDLDPFPDIDSDQESVPNTDVSDLKSVIDVDEFHSSFGKFVAILAVDYWVDRLSKGESITCDDKTQIHFDRKRIYAVNKCIEYTHTFAIDETSLSIIDKHALSESISEYLTKKLPAGRAVSVDIAPISTDRVIGCNHDLIIVIKVYIT